ncbi:MAG TPA: hypothetical protein VIW23_07840 [Candidatus Acidoferrum sp.]
MPRRFIAIRTLPPMLALTLCCFTGQVFGQLSKIPTAATEATVQADAVTVFAEMDSSSEQTSTLKKGNSVYVDLRIDQSGKSWCGIRSSAQTNRIGFVDCKTLQRVASSVPTIRPGANVAASGPSRSAPAEIPLARSAIPTASGYDALKNQIVKEGVIDSGLIAALEEQTSNGGSAAMARAALAHLVAGEFELSQHEPDKATEHFEAATTYAGNQRNLVLASLEGRVYALLMESEFGSAQDLIERARKLSPQSAQLAALSGWAHYRLNQLDAAIDDFRLAQRMRPDANVARLLERATSDKEAESDFREGESQHFVVRYHGGASRALASDVTRTLEEQFEELRNQFRYTPPEPIGVILYTQEAFRDVTGVPSWAGVVNDGRIRVPVQGMETVSEPLARSLKHELTHSFVFQKTSGRCPTWLQEGIAQWISGRRSSNAAALLVSMYQDGKEKSLRHMEGSWMKLSAAEAQFSYAWALAMVETIEADSGSDGLGRLLDAVRTESSMGAALLQALRTNYSSLDDATAEYLRRTYLQ